MQNAKQIWQETAKQLQKVYEQREAESITYLLLEDLFDFDRVSILSGDNKSFDSKLLADSIVRLLDYEPLQHITGIADFYGRKFEISSNALIPRPETEELIDLILSDSKIDKPNVLDVGTGSGCIAITLALELKGELHASDVSQEALLIAKKNAKELTADVSFYLSDVLTNDLPINELDILVSNPPYIPNEDKEQMHENVLKYEPDLALFVPDDDPLVFYRSIAKRGVKSLKTGGKLYFEIHERFGNETADLLKTIGYSDVKIHKDMQGKDRMIRAINSANR